MVNMYSKMVDMYIVCIYTVYSIAMIYRCIWMIWIKSLKADNPISVCCIIDPTQNGCGDW